MICSPCYWETGERIDVTQKARYRDPEIQEWGMGIWRSAGGAVRTVTITEIGICPRHANQWWERSRAGKIVQLEIWTP